MKIACLGGGPAGLYFAISMKLRDTAHDITVFERNRPDDTFGWGVVFSDETFDNIAVNDPVSAETIRGHFNADRKNSALPPAAGRVMNEADRVIFLAGQVGWNAEQQFASQDFVAQARLSLAFA